MLCRSELQYCTLCGKKKKCPDCCMKFKFAMFSFFMVTEPARVALVLTDLCKSCSA